LCKHLNKRGTELLLSSLLLLLNLSTMMKINTVSYLVIRSMNSGLHIKVLQCQNFSRKSSSELSVTYPSTSEPRQLSRYSDWLRAEQPRGRSSCAGGGKNFHFFMSYRPVLRPTQPTIQWVRGVLSSGVKRPGSETDHSPPTSTEVKKMWIYTSTPTYAFMA
jgi:hypothetical protein